MTIDLKELIAAGVHFGHQTCRWSPKMAPYIWGHKNKVHLINVAATAHGLEKAAQFLTSVAADNKQILFVGTKKSAQAAIQKVATALPLPSVTGRWIGGTLTNAEQTRKSCRKYLIYKDILEKSDQFPYTKKERNRLQKAVNRLHANIGGILNLRLPLGAIVIVDVRKEQAALKEAIAMGIPVVAVVDTNSDPSPVNYVIPGNDDSAKSVSMLIGYLEQAIIKGKEIASERKQQEAQASEAAAEAATEALTHVGTESLLEQEPLLESDEGDLAREQVKARKMKESIKAKKGDPKKAPGRGRSR